MKVYQSIVMIILLLSFPLAGMADEVFFPRFPDISPDGKTVVFTFQGDIWTASVDGGQAQRLTANPAYDQFAVFSPDGKSIVFTSNRNGSYDLYIMPSTGGIPERLTFSPATDLAQDWTPDGKTILLKSRHPYEYPVDYQIFTMPASGGTPFRFTEFFANEIVVSPDGKSYLLAIGDNRFGRRGYRGTLQSDIWLWKEGQDPVKITDDPGYDTDPMWAPDGNTVYFRGEDDKSNAFNIWKMNLDGSGRTRLTNFTDKTLGVRNARISESGIIVFEAEYGIYTFDPTSGKKPVQIKLEAAADLIEKPVVTSTFTSGASDLTADSEGEEYAIIVEGDIVLINKELGGRATVPVPDPARDQNIAFKPGTADTLLFDTDRWGEGKDRVQRVALLISDDKDESLLREAKKWKIEYLTGTDENCFDPQWSPDGKKIAYVSGQGDLMVMDADGGGKKKLFTSPNTPSFSWSPDSRWIAYSVEDNEYNGDIWIIPAKGGEAYNVSQHPDDDFSPKWSKDGRMIAWTTRRHDNQYDVYFAYLTKADDQRTKEEWEIWEKTRDKPNKKDKDEEEKDEDEEEIAPEDTFEVRIDFDGLYERGRRLTSSPNTETAAAIHPRGDKIFFVRHTDGDASLIAVNRFGKDEETIIESLDGGVLFDATAEKFYLIKGGKPAVVGMDGGKVETTDFEALLTIDKPARHLQILDEAYYTLGDWFYDPRMHGVDWAHQRDLVEPIIRNAFTEEDFADGMNLMIRGLNSSHMGYYPPGRNSAYRTPGFLGLEFDPTYKGKGLKVASVMMDSPADMVKTRILPDDIITEVNGMPVSATENYFRTMVDRDDNPAFVTFKRGGETLTYKLSPTSWSGMFDIAYNQMVKENRAYVEKKSNGKVGYVHIQGMGWAQVELFERDLYAAAHDKDALIIDVRWNGGGWTTDMLLTILTQPEHAYTIGRDGDIGYPQPRYPMYRWTKPIAVICDENSYSNAEIFSHAIKTIDRGPVVGNITGGNVISTGGWTTQDGGHVRMPFRGFYVWGDKKHPERNNKNQEHGGAIPDYIVVLTPGDRMHDRDPQLDKATDLMIEAAKEEAMKPTPKPKDPAAAKYSK